VQTHVAVIKLSFLFLLKSSCLFYKLFFVFPLFFLFFISMLISTSLLLVCSAVAAVVAAPTDEYTGGKRIVRVPFKKVARPNGHRLTKRDPFQTTLYNDDGSQYLITVNIGTPAQTFTVALDTGR
jgi:hypothetical protein